MKQIERDIQDIKDRNNRVEADKTWEVSVFRKTSLAVITYVVASFVLYFIGVSDYLISALIPTIGYILSVQSLPALKRSWQNRRKN
ncbi:MAG: hypothetical protein V4526_02995 [Patescibacteria group bacterium]